MDFLTQIYTSPGSFNSFGTDSNTKSYVYLDWSLTFSSAPTFQIKWTECSIIIRTISSMSNRACSGAWVKNWLHGSLWVVSNWSTFFELASSTKKALAAFNEKECQNVNDLVEHVQISSRPWHSFCMQISFCFGIEWTFWTSSINFKQILRGLSKRKGK